MFSQYEEYQNFKKSQKKAAGKSNRNIDNNPIVSEEYLQYFKHNVKGQKRQMGIPTTYIVGEVTTNGVKKLIRI
jgi:hypothetical protein